MVAIWHPFADMGAVDAGGRLVIERGDGVYIWDSDGRRYLDAIAALWFCNVGYGREKIANAAAAQMKTLHAYHTFGDLANKPAMELAERLSSFAPVPGSKVFFTSGGSDSVDTAAKLVRRYWHLQGRSDKTGIINRALGYHGMHGFGTSLAGIEANRSDYGPMVEDVLAVAWDSAEALVELISHRGSDSIAAFFCEPIMGVGGVLIPPPGYLKEVREVCREADVLFVADEVITGFGRVGDWFASTRFGLEPDIITFAKGVTSGYAPLGGVIVAPRIAEPFWREDGGVTWRHGYTYSGHAAACAAGLANLDILEREDLLARSLALENELLEALVPLVDHPLVTEVRGGTGAMAAVQLDVSAVDTDPSLPDRALEQVRRAGIMSRVLNGHAFQVSPPLTIARWQLSEIADGFRTALDSV